MTRNVSPGFTFTPEPFAFTLQGIHTHSAKVTLYDPYHDKYLPVKATTVSSSSLTIKANAADYPYLLIVQELPGEKDQVHGPSQRIGRKPGLRSGLPS
jgi:hypothetical protein